MVTGQPPWKSLKFGSPAALMFHIANAEAPPPLPLTKLSTELKELLFATFSRDTNMRPTANQLLQYQFVVACGAATEAVAAGTQVLPRFRTPLHPQQPAVKQISFVEELAD